MSEQLTYTVIQSPTQLDEWHVEASLPEGTTLINVFSGPMAEGRAREYAEWKNAANQAAAPPRLRLTFEPDLPGPGEPFATSYPNPANIPILVLTLQDMLGKLRWDDRSNIAEVIRTEREHVGVCGAAARALREFRDFLFQFFARPPEDFAPTPLSAFEAVKPILRMREDESELIEPIDAEGRLVIPFHDQGPVRIVAADWPVIVAKSHRREWREGDAPVHIRTDYLVVRQHADGSYLVYGRGGEGYGGYLVTGDADRMLMGDKLSTLRDRIGIHHKTLNESISALPARDLK